MDGRDSSTQSPNFAESLGGNSRWATDEDENGAVRVEIPPAERTGLVDVQALSGD